MSSSSYHLCFILPALDQFASSHREEEISQCCPLFLLPFLILLFTHPSSFILMLKRKRFVIIIIIMCPQTCPPPMILVLLSLYWTGLRPITERKRFHDVVHFSFSFFLSLSLSLLDLHGQLLMCRINAVGHFTQRQVHSVAGRSLWCHGILAVFCDFFWGNLTGRIGETFQIPNRSTMNSAAAAQRCHLISAAELW